MYDPRSWPSFNSVVDRDLIITVTFEAEKGLRIHYEIGLINFRSETYFDLLEFQIG